MEVRLRFSTIASLELFEEVHDLYIVVVVVVVVVVKQQGGEARRKELARPFCKKRTKELK